MTSAVATDSTQHSEEQPAATPQAANAIEPTAEPTVTTQVGDIDPEHPSTTDTKEHAKDKTDEKDQKPISDDAVSPLDLKDPSTSSPTPVASAPTPSKRRPNPPSKGILKPPPPPAKPSLGNRLRDIVTVVGGGAKSFFETPEESQTDPNGPHTAGPSTPLQGTGTAGAVGGALNALGGRIGLGFSRLVASASPGSPSASLPPSTDVTPVGSPGPSRSLSLPDARASVDKGKRRDLKRATFLLPSLSITYPISSQGEPWSEKVLLERQKIESTHRSLLHSTTGAEYWTSQRLVALYENACKGREERPRVGIVRALEVLPKPPRTRTLHIVLRPFDPTLPPLPHPAPYTLETPLNRHASEAFADVLSIECGLVDLRLESGALDGDDALKAILHALLVSGTLPNLSLAGNRKIKAGGWRLLGIFLKRARSLRYLDVSETNWDRKSIEYLVQALNTPRHPPSLPPETPSKAQKVLGLRDRSKSEPTNRNSDTTPSSTDGSDAEDDGTSITTSDRISVYGSFIPPAPLLKNVEEDAPASLQTLRMDGCVFRSNVLEALAQGIRSSDLRNISMRRNKIGPLGAVALALMIRDYPDSAVSMSSFSPGLTASLSNSSLVSLEQQLSPSPSPVPYAKYPRRPISSPLKDDTPLPSLPNASTPALSTPRALHSPPPRHSLPLPNSGTSHARDGSYSLNTAPVEGKLTHVELGGASIALQRSVRALDGVERIGRLLTLDLKGNEIRGGVGYIAQVLKRNRTLKVLNLSENRIDPTGLVSLAESLKYNSTLETLDLSSNPCCGPTLEGVTALRTAFTVNTSLKRLFLSDTSLTTEGAIALAEFLPESKSLLHIDLTSNLSIEPAGIMAMSVGLKSNTLIRCLDLSIPPNAPELADLSQNILQICIRNTELAAAKSDRSELVWAPIKKSTLVKDVKRADDERADAERLEQAVSPEGLAREYVYTLKPEHVRAVTEDTIRDLEKWYAAAKAASGNGFNAWEPGQLPQEDYQPILQRGKALQERLVEVIQTSSDDQLEDLLSLNDTLGILVDRSKGFNPPPRLLLPSQVISPDHRSLAPGRSRSSSTSRRHMRVSSLEISSPNFSIGDSDNDSDAEELDVGTISSNTTPRPTAIRRTSGPRPAPTPSPLDLSDAEPADPRDRAETAEARETEEVQIEVGLEASTPRSPEDVASPVERVSKAWVEEEGEIFRKGTRLGVVDDEEENEVSGEDLKQEILDTPVPRSPTRRLIEESEEASEEETKTAEGDDC